MLAARSSAPTPALLEATDEADLGRARRLRRRACASSRKARRYFAMVALPPRACRRSRRGHRRRRLGDAQARRARAEAPDRPPIRAPTASCVRRARCWRSAAARPAPRPTDAEDGDIAARCALQRGDVDGAPQILAQTIERRRRRQERCARFWRSARSSSAPAISTPREAAYRKVLALYPQHPRALVGPRAGRRSSAARRRAVEPARQGRLGPTTEGLVPPGAGPERHGRGAPDDAGDLPSSIWRARASSTTGAAGAALRPRAAAAGQGRRGRAGDARRRAARSQRRRRRGARRRGGAGQGLRGQGGARRSRRSADAAQPGGARPRAGADAASTAKAVATLDAALARRPGDAIAITYRAIARAPPGRLDGRHPRAGEGGHGAARRPPHYGLGLLAYERHDPRAAQRASSAGARAQLGVVPRPRAARARACAISASRRRRWRSSSASSREAPALMPVQAALGPALPRLGRDREARTDAAQGPRRRHAQRRGQARPSPRRPIELGHVDEGERRSEDATDAGIPAARGAPQAGRCSRGGAPRRRWPRPSAWRRSARDRRAHDARLALTPADAWRRAGDPRKAGEILRGAGRRPAARQPRPRPRAVDCRTTCERAESLVPRGAGGLGQGRLRRSTIRPRRASGWARSLPVPARRWRRR